MGIEPKKYSIVGDDGELVEPDITFEPTIDVSTHGYTSLANDLRGSTLTHSPLGTPVQSQKSNMALWVVLGTFFVVAVVFLVQEGGKQSQVVAATNTVRAATQVASTAAVVNPLPGSISDAVRTSANSESLIRDIEWSPDGTQLAVNNFNDLTRIWNVEDGSQALALDYYSYEKMAWSPDGTRLITSARGETVIWDTVTGEQLDTLPSVGRGSTSASIEWSFDDRYIAAVDSFSRHILSVYDAASGARIRSFDTENWVHKEPIWGIAWTQGGLFAMTMHNIIRWDLTTWEHEIFQHINYWDSDFQRWASIAATVDGRYLAISTVRGGSNPHDGQMFIWDTTTNSGINLETPPILNFPLTGATPVHSISWSPDSSQIATRGRNSISIWDATIGERQRIIYSTDDIRDVDWSPHGEHLAVCSDYVVRIYSLEEEG